MVKLEEQGLVTIQPCTQDKEEKYFFDSCGWAQRKLETVSANWRIFIRIFLIKKSENLKPIKTDY